MDIAVSFEESKLPVLGFLELFPQPTVSIIFFTNSTEGSFVDRNYVGIHFKINLLFRGRSPPGGADGTESQTRCQTPEFT
jgi:hypothetical protein